MTLLNLGENITRLRHEKKLTQEEIADFVGVTKASVSKWENKQSMPDITILPTLATLFDVSVDELLGYEPQLNDKQIRKIYTDLAAEFAKLPMEEAFEKVVYQVKKYYNCYPFILYMCVLMINNIATISDPQKKQELMPEVQKWCDHIIENCKVPNVVEDAVSVRTLIDFTLGKYAEVIEALEEGANPLRMSNSNDLLLIQGFSMVGDLDRAEKYAQTMIIQCVLNILSVSSIMLAVQPQNQDWCNETIKRIDQLIESYRLDQVNKNTTVQFYYQASINKLLYGEKEQAYVYLKKYVENGIDLLKHTEKIFEMDPYFKRTEEWIQETVLGPSLPRDKKFIASDLLMMLENPVFAGLAGEQKFENLKKKMKEEL